MTYLTAEHFESLVGQSISISTTSGPEAWQVLSVVRLKPHALRKDPPFSVNFAAPPHNDRQQGTRAGTTASGEPIEFFAVAVGASTTEVSYEAVFN